MAQGNGPRNNWQNNQGNNQGNKNNQPKSPEAGLYVAKFRSEFVSLKTRIDTAKNRDADILLDAIKAGTKDTAEGVFSTAIRGYIDQAKSFLDTFPDESTIGQTLSGKDKTTEITNLSKIKEEVSKYITRLQDDYGLGFKDRMKDAEKRSPEQVDKDNRKKLGDTLGVMQDSQTKLLTIFSRLEERKKTNKKLSDEENLRYTLEIDVLKLRIQTTYSEFLALDELEEDDDFRLAPDRDPVQKKIIDIIEKTFQELVGNDDPDSSVISKVITALEKPVDETKEKFPEFGKEMDEVQRNLSQIQKEIDDARKGKDKRVDKDDVDGLQTRIVQEESKLELIRYAFEEAYMKLSTDLADQGKTPTAKQHEQYQGIRNRHTYMCRLSDNLREKVIDGPSLKDQRENVKSIAGRVTDIEKMMKTDYDALEIGKKYEDGQKATYTLLLDSEVISSRDAREDMEALPDTPENQPTRETLDRQLEETDKRIKKLQDKIAKERVAKEKEVKEKLDASEAEIEKMEDKIREQKSKDAAGKLKVAENLKPENQEKMGVLNKLWAPFVKYKNGLTYDDQKNVHDQLKDPGDDIKKVKEWIDKMPEETDKELKLKKRLMKKAKRLSARRRSSMLRHFFALSGKEEGKFVGNAIGEKIGNAVLDKMLG